MSRVVRRRWLSTHDGPSRKDNRGCEYEAYVPDMLVGRNFTFDGAVAADVADAEAAIARLNVEAVSLVDTEALARILLRAESVASSRIEGLEIGARRLLRAEAAQVLGDEPSDITAVEVLRNIDAMVYGVGAVGPGDHITVETILEIHRRLLFGTRFAEYGGRFREQQNWIGGSAYSPCSAAFVPPPTEYVEDLMSDVVAFANEDSLPAVAQAAIAHAQFETIHPFLDGNGRLGRLLITFLLCAQGALREPILYLSLYFKTNRAAYYELLERVRTKGDWEAWLDFFLIGVRDTAEQAASAAREILEHFSQDQKKIETLGRPAASVLRVFQHMQRNPIIAIPSAAKKIGISAPTVAKSLGHMIDLGILEETTGRERHRLFVYKGYLDILNEGTEPLR